MVRIHTDLSRVPISVAPDPATTGTSLGVTDANAAFLPQIYPYFAVLCPTGVSASRDNSEIVKVTAGSSSGGTTTLTIVRTQGIPITTAQTVTTSFDIYEAVATELAVDNRTNMQNLLKNGNFINNSTNGYGTTPDNWTSSSANPVQGGFPTMTKAQLISLLGISDGDIEGLWNLNEASGDAVDLSSNGYNLTDTNTVTNDADGLMSGGARKFTAANSEYFTIAHASAGNLEITGSQTWICYVKVAAEDITGNARLMSKKANSRELSIDSSDIFVFRGGGLTTSTQIVSDIKPEAGKWYMVIGVYDSVNTKLKLWVNSIKKEVTASGSFEASTTEFTIGRPSNTNGNYANGLVQNCGILSVALTDAQVQRLFAATLYKGQKIRRATTDAAITQALPEDLVERLRGKTVTVAVDAYKNTAGSDVLISIDDGTDTEGTAIASADSWLTASATKTISASATSITIKSKCKTADGVAWFKKTRFYEGSSVLPYDHSKDDWSRFNRALLMEFVDLGKGYRIDGNMAYFAGALTTTELTRDGQMGYDTTNNRLYIREQGVVKYVAMT